MKKRIILSSCLCAALMFSAHAQVAPPSDNPALFHLAPSKLPPANNHATHHAKASPCTSPSVSGNVVYCDSGSAILVASGATNYVWLNSNDSAISSMATDTTGMIYTTQIYRAAAVCDTDTLLMDEPLQASTYSGMVRGYWFTAPCNFIINGVRVPTDNVGAQTIELVRFTAGSPPAYPGTTNSFVVLGYWNSVNTVTVIDTNIVIHNGDVLGVYGWRGTTDSYTSGGDYPSAIGPYPVTLQRSGMQDDLNVNPMHDIWSEAGGSLSRVELYYSIPDTSATVGDTVFIHPSSSITDSTTICQGDSIMLGGGYQTTPGTYLDSLTSTFGCDSVVTTHLAVNPRPTISVSGMDTISSGGVDTLIASGSSTSYVWSTGGTTDSIKVSPATTTTYTVTGTLNGCSDTATFTVNIKVVGGINSINNTGGISAYPVPAKEILNITFNSGSIQHASIKVLNTLGQQLSSIQSSISKGKVVSINISTLAKGVYFVKVVTGTSSQTVKFIKE